MNRRIVLWSRLAAPVWASLPVDGAVITRLPNPFDSTVGRRRQLATCSCLTGSAGRRRQARGQSPAHDEERIAILESSITLIQRAALQPGGENFELAVKKLNQYFEGTTSGRVSARVGGRANISAPSCRQPCSRSSRTGTGLSGTRGTWKTA